MHGSSVRPFRGAFFAGLGMAFLLLILGWVQPGRAEDVPLRGDVRIVLLHTNDMHGQVRPISLRKGKVSVGGFARVAASVTLARKEAREKGWHLFLLDAGDCYQGTPEGNLSKGALVVDLMGRIGYQAMAVGNHEFDNGRKNVAALSKAAPFPFLAANVVVDSTGKTPDFLTPYLLLKAGKVSVGVFGLITPDVPLYTFPDHTQGLRFEPSAEAAVRTVKALRAAGAQVIVALTHIGLSDDIELAKACPGIDVIVGGHSHSVVKRGLTAEGTSTLIVQAGGKTGFLGRTELFVNQASGKVVHRSSRLISLRSPDVEEDPAMAGRIAELCLEIDKKMDVPVGEAAEDISRSGWKFSGRSSPLGNLVTDVMRLATKSDLAFQNRTGMRDNFRTGKISLRDVYRVSPFGNTVVVMTLTGRQVQDLLTYALTYGTRYLLEISGGKVVYSRKDDKATILTLTVGGNPIDPEGRYRVATSNFIAAGGDGHKLFTQGAKTVDTGLLLRDLMADHIRRNSPLHRNGELRIEKRK